MTGSTHHFHNKKEKRCRALDNDIWIRLTFTLVIFSNVVNLIGWMEKFSPLSKAKRNDGSSSSLQDFDISENWYRICISVTKIETALLTLLPNSCNMWKYSHTALTRKYQNNGPPVKGEIEQKQHEAGWSKYQFYIWQYSCNLGDPRLMLPDGPELVMDNGFRNEGIINNKIVSSNISLFLYSW